MWSIIQSCRKKIGQEDKYIEENPELSDFTINQESQLPSSEWEINRASDHQRILPITRIIIPYTDGERELSEDNINQLMNEGLPVNEPKNQSQETYWNRDCRSRREVAEIADEIGNLQEVIPEQ